MKIIFFHPFEHDRVRIAQHENPVSFPAQIKQHIEFVVGNVDQKTAPGGIDLPLIDMMADLAIDQIVNGPRFDLALFELQENAGLAVGLMYCRLNKT